jgi:ATP-dependent DNA helicase RecQ
MDFPPETPPPASSDRPIEERIAECILAVFDRLEATQRKYGRRKIMDIMKGRYTSATVKNRDYESPVFGALSDFSNRQVEGFLDDLLMQGALSIEGSPLPTLRRNPIGGPALAVRLPFDLGQKSQPAFDPCLYEHLVKIRGAQAKDEGISPFCIVPNRVLMELVARRPADIGQMLKVPGVGEAKALKYGELFLKGIADYRPAST